MKKIETNFLIYDLAKKGNNKKRVSGFKFFISIFLCSGIFLALYLLNSSFRQDLFHALSFNWLFYFQAIVLFITVILGICLCYRLINPGLELEKKHILLQCVFYGMWSMFAGLLTVGVLVDSANSLDIMQQLDFDCVARVLMGSFVPLLLIGLLVRKGYCVDKVDLIVNAALSALGFGAVLNLFICDVDNYIHLIVSHYLPIFPVVLFMLLLNKLFNK